MENETSTTAETATKNIDGNLVLAEVKIGEEESIQCPYCDGAGWTAEHNPASEHNGEHNCDGCPIQLPCGYCYANGRVTTKLMKEHIEASKRKDYNDDLPF